MLLKYFIKLIGIFSTAYIVHEHRVIFAVISPFRTSSPLWPFICSVDYGCEFVQIR